MKLCLGIVGLLALVVVGAWLGPDAWGHYQLYKSVQSERRGPYRVETRGLEYFSPLVEHRGWHVMPRSGPQLDRSWDKILDTLKWPRSLRSVELFYTTNTSTVGVMQWMLVPDSSRLPTLQTMVFRRLSEGVVYRDREGRYIVEESSPSMVSLIQESDGGVTEALLIDDQMFKRIQEKKRRPNQALEPTTPAVTIPAAQEVAPAGVVAHL